LLIGSRRQRLFALIIHIDFFAGRFAALIPARSQFVAPRSSSAAATAATATAAAVARSLFSPRAIFAVLRFVQSQIRAFGHIVFQHGSALIVFARRRNSRFSRP
jgi:hypothetical protein